MKHFALIIATLCCTVVYAQPDSLEISFILPEVEVEPDRELYSPGFEVTTDSVFAKYLPSLSLGQILEMNGLSGVRTYGASGTLISALNKGLSSDHTLVTWNGIPLNTPSLGSTDISLVPSALFSNITFQSDQFNSAGLSGGAAGAIRLRDYWENATVISTYIDDTFNASALARSGYRINSNFKGITTLSVFDARNEFEYVDPFQPIAPGESAISQEQGFNNFHQKAFKQRFEFGSTNGLWGAHVAMWAQQSRLAIPSNFGALNHQTGAQRDSSLRFTANVTYAKGDREVTLRMGLFNDFQRFESFVDDTQSIISEIDNRRNYLSLLAQRKWGKGRFGASLTVDDQLATGVNYPDEEASQLLYGARLFGAVESNSWFAEGDIRFDLVNENLAVNGDARVGYRKDQWTFSGSLQRVFRYADLNELHWISGGNPNLNPEQGWSYNLSTDWRFKNDKQALELMLNGYYTTMESVILWVPGDQFWGAQNVDSIQTFGLIGAINHSVSFGDMKLSSRIRANIHQDSNEDEALEAFYPALRLSYILQGNWRRLNVGANLRYTANEWEYEALNATQGEQDAVFTADVFAGIAIGPTSRPVTLNFYIRNLGNTMDYRVSRTPSPGRVVSLAVSWNIKHQSK
ncbi:hypothetical protein [Sanyastnella coralliicola]|uniref:hypothetical protein n=1 Tax=Sanyastnella coralliicola TaxID=3069118 RepID=UPI0027BB01EF|nr:hypothetical protein [Longitalea sp. SCSIO 12813]